MDMLKKLSNFATRRTFLRWLGGVATFGIASVGAVRNGSAGIQTNGSQAQASEASVGSKNGVGIPINDTFSHSAIRGDDLKSYLYQLPEQKWSLKAKAEPEWDSGVTARMIEASTEYINGLEEMLVNLSRFYPSGHFGTIEPIDYFSTVIRNRANWHHILTEIGGTGSGGTIVPVIVSGKVMHDVEVMVEDMVDSLAGYDDGFDHKWWRHKWRGTTQDGTQRYTSNRNWNGCRF